jgi:hypothetical protein
VAGRAAEGKGGGFAGGDQALRRERDVGAGLGGLPAGGGHGGGGVEAVVAEAGADAVRQLAPHGRADPGGGNGGAVAVDLAPFLMAGRQELHECRIVYARNGVRPPLRRQHRPQLRFLDARQHDLRPSRDLEARHEAPAAELDLGIVQAVLVGVDGFMGVRSSQQSIEVVA